MSASSTRGRERRPQQGRVPADKIPCLGGEQPPFCDLFILGEDKTRERMPFSALGRGINVCSRKPETFQPSVLVKAPLFPRLEIPTHGFLPERVRHVPAFAIGSVEARDGINLAYAEIGQTFSTDRYHFFLQPIKTGFQQTYGPSACGESEVAPQRVPHKSLENPARTLSPFFFLHHASEDYGVGFWPETVGS